MQYCFNQAADEFNVWDLPFEHGYKLADRRVRRQDKFTYMWFGSD